MTFFDILRATNPNLKKKEVFSGRKFMWRDPQSSKGGEGGMGSARNRAEGLKMHTTVTDTEATVGQAGKLKKYTPITLC